MPVLENARYEAFAQAVCKGDLTPTDAYREVLGKAAKDADVNACRWAKRPPIAARIAELKAETASHCLMSREKFVNSLVAMYEAKPEDASMSNPLCETLVTRGQRIPVFPQKMPVAAQLMKVLGYEKPTEVKVELGDKLSGLLDRLFTPPA